MVKVGNWVIMLWKSSQEDKGVCVCGGETSWAHRRLCSLSQEYRAQHLGERCLSDVGAKEFDAAHSLFGIPWCVWGGSSFTLRGPNMLAQVLWRSLCVGMHVCLPLRNECCCNPACNTDRIEQCLYMRRCPVWTIESHLWHIPERAVQPFNAQPGQALCKMPLKTLNIFLPSDLLRGTVCSCYFLFYL